ncbi:Lactose transport system permease protein LacF [compost metagenome]
MNIGLLNSFLKEVGLGSLARPWLNDPKLAVFVTMVPFVLYVGVTMVIFLMQITAIPQEIYEAAEIDGATGWQKDWSITIPLLRGGIAVNVIFNVTACLKMFEYPWLMTGGGPARSSMNVSLYIYQEMMTANRYGVSMAAGLLTIAFGVLVIVSSLYTMRWAEGRGK